jgi:hypothetical protein
MSENVSEDSSLSNEDSDTVLPFIKTRRAKRKNGQFASAQLAAGTTSSLVKAKKRVTFDTAFSKALPVRRRQLGLSPGSRLPREEFLRLRNAVRKQCTRVTSDVFSKRLMVLEERVNELDSQIGPDPGVRAVRMLQLFHLQLDVARQQLLDLMSESTALSEGCSHVAGKKRVKVYDNYDIQVVGPGLPMQMLSLSRGSRLLCCPRCLQSRQDLIFESFGVEKLQFVAGAPKVLPDTISFGFFRYEKPPPGFPLELNPLLLQELWAALLDVKFGRINAE